jgi:hypothetical protein
MFGNWPCTVYGPDAPVNSCEWCREWIRIERELAALKGGPMRMTKVQQIRRAVADYMLSEGCSCCRDVEAHAEHGTVLAKLLRVPKYRDGSGYDFFKFRTGCAALKGGK